MAPELEDGGQLQVTAAADVYSLGKLLYFLLSGGVVLPRERLHEDQFSRVFAKGERYQLLQHLLTKMICHRETRIQTIAEVIGQMRQRA